jgi:hypothetical protein
MMLMQQLIVEIQIQVSWGVIIFEDKPPIKVALADQKILKLFRTDNLNSHFRELTKVPIKVEALKIWFSHISTTELEEKLAKELNLGSFEERPFKKFASLPNWLIPKSKNCWLRLANNPPFVTSDW